MPYVYEFEWVSAFTVRVYLPFAYLREWCVQQSAV